MTKLYLPQKQKKKQQAYERIIAQMMDKIQINFPTKIKDKEQFLQTIISRCEEKGFDKKFQCKWGWIKKPIEFLESMNEEEWEIAGETEKKGEKFTTKKSDMELLFNTRVEIPKLNKEEYEKVCDALKREYREKDYTGKPGTIIYDTPKKKVNYDKLVKEYKKLLHAIKLFKLGGIHTPKVEIVRKVAEDMFNIEKWDDVFRELKKKAFFSEEEDSIEIDDRYINEVIHDYSPDESTYKLKRELTELIEVLTTQKAVEELGNVGEMFISRGEYEDALKCYNNALEFEKKNPYFYSRRGNMYHKLEDFENAKKDYDQAIELKTKKAYVYNNLGVLYYNKKQLDDALANYNTAIELDENYATAYHNRGIIYAKMNQYNDALANYNTAIELDENAFAYYNRGRLYYKKKQDKKALADYNKAIELDENLAPSYNSRGFFYFRKGNYNLALEDITHAIDIDAKFALAYANRCEVYFYLDEKELAVEDIKIAKKLDPQVLVDNLKYRLLEDEFFPADLASLILSHLEDIYDSFSVEEKKVIDDVKIRIST